MLDGDYRRNEAGPVFVEAPAPTDEVLRTALHEIITRMTILFTHRGVFVERQAATDMADNDTDSDEARGSAIDARAGVYFAATNLGQRVSLMGRQEPFALLPESRRPGAPNGALAIRLGGTGTAFGEGVRCHRRCPLAR